MSRGAGIALVIVAIMAGGCAEPAMTDYSAFIRHMPRSILVLPPVNSTASVRAPDLYLSTVTRPLAEQGYYVFPIAVVDRLMKDNGAPTPGDMHRVLLRKLQEIFGADAVLYVEIEKWTTSYIGIATSTEVRISYRLVDVGTGETLWQRRVMTGENSAEYARGDASGGGVILAIFMAQVQAIGAAISDPEIRWARAANYQAFQNRVHGLLLAPLHPNYDTDPRRVTSPPSP